MKCVFAESVLTGCYLKSGYLKFSKMDKFFKGTFKTCKNEPENVPSTGNVVKKQKVSEDNTGKIRFRVDFLGVVMKMLQNHSALFVGSNWQMKQ